MGFPTFPSSLSARPTPLGARLAPDEAGRPADTPTATRLRWCTRNRDTRPWRRRRRGTAACSFRLAVAPPSADGKRSRDQDGSCGRLRRQSGRLHRSWWVSSWRTTSAATPPRPVLLPVCRESRRAGRVPPPWRGGLRGGRGRGGVAPPAARRLASVPLEASPPSLSTAVAAAAQMRGVARTVPFLPPSPRGAVHSAALRAAVRTPRVCYLVRPTRPTPRVAPPSTDVTPPPSPPPPAGIRPPPPANPPPSPLTCPARPTGRADQDVSRVARPPPPSLP